MATYQIVVDDALTEGLTFMLQVKQEADIQTMLSNAATELGKQGSLMIQQQNAQIMANALAQGMTPAQAAALIQ